MSVRRNRSLAWPDGDKMAGGQTCLRVLAAACPSQSCLSPAHLLTEEDPDLPPIRLLLKLTMPSGGVRRCVSAPTLLYNLALKGVRIARIVGHLRRLAAGFTPNPNRRVILHPLFVPVHPTG